MTEHLGIMQYGFSLIFGVLLSVCFSGAEMDRDHFWCDLRQQSC